MKHLFLSAIALALFYLFYKWLLSRDTLHRFNRVVLLTTLVLTAVLPLVHIDFGLTVRGLSTLLEEVIVTPANGFEPARLAEVPQGTSLIDASFIAMSDSLFMTVGVAFAGYLLIAFILLLVFLYRLTGLIGRCRGAESLPPALPKEGRKPLPRPVNGLYTPSWLPRLSGESNPRREGSCISSDSRGLEVLPTGEDLGGASDLGWASGCRLLLHDDNFAPYSWMHTIVVSRKDYAANGPMIIAHEQAHIRLGHSWDLLLAQLCCIVQWFNPAAWLMKKELQAVHEYEADEAMLRSGCDAHQYQMKLIETALGARFSSMANNFTNVSTKKRILMMMKKKTNPLARMKALYLLPVAALIVFTSSTTYRAPQLATDDDDTTTPSGVTVVTYGQGTVTPDSLALMEAEARKYLAENCKKTEKESTGAKETLEVCDVLPEYPGGMEELFAFLAKNIKYPVPAQQADQQGRVIVRFVVEQDGSITDLEVLKGVSPLLDAEAVRVVKSMPRWTPGKQKGQNVRVQFVLPVTFRLNG